MDKIKSVGTAIQAVIGPTVQTYSPLLQANAAAIKSTPRETHSYGPHPRQALDVYKPTSSALDTASVVMFIHGGGFSRGAKNLDNVPDDLAYANVGHFFASRGYIAVVINYRLVGVHAAKYPSGGEDVDLAVQWVRENYLGQRSLYLFGNSAGGCHLASFVFDPRFKSTLDKVTDPHTGRLALKGVGFVSTPFTFPTPPLHGDIPLKEYYGEDFAQKCPRALVQAAPEDVWSLLERARVHFSLFYFEHDPEDIIVRTVAGFEETWHEKRGNSPKLTKFFVEGHNHISHALALGTGIEKEEAWGVELVQWMEEART